MKKGTKLYKQAIIIKEYAKLNGFDACIKEKQKGDYIIVIK